MQEDKNIVRSTQVVEISRAVVRTLSHVKNGFKINFFVEANPNGNEFFM